MLLRKKEIKKKEATAALDGEIEPPVRAEKKEENTIQQ